MCSGSEEGSHLRLIDFVYHSTLGLRVIKRGGHLDNEVEPEEVDGEEGGEEEDERVLGRLLVPNSPRTRLAPVAHLPGGRGRVLYAT